MTTQTRNESATKAFVTGAAAIAIGTLVLLAAPAASFAEQEPSSVHEARVSYADLDLTRPEGIETLRTRVESAARAVCGSRQASTMKEIALARACYQDAVAEAMRQVELPVAAQLHWTVSMMRDAS